MSARSERKYDIVVYGATGFTGQFVVEEVAKFAQLEKERGVTSTLSWAVAGRNEGKLKDSIEFAKRETGLNLENIDVIIADSSNPESIHSMAQQSKVIINCVGPYHKFGEPVVKACIENKTDHVDISGEPQFLDGMRLKFNQAAEDAGVHIVGACGYDSVPADIGLCHMMKHFKGRLNSAECYLKTSGMKSPTINTGTMESAALAIANGSLISEIRRKLYPEKLPKPKFKKEKRGILHKNADLNLWAIPLPTDEPMVYRTQRYFFEKTGQAAIQFQGFVAFRTSMQALGTLIGAMYFILMSYFGWTRKLLIKYPEVMTAGVFSRKGPAREDLKQLTFTSTIIGKGWAEKLKENSDQYSSPPDSKIIVKVSGPDPGYRATSAMIVSCAMTLLREKDKCSESGGVMSPGMAFYNTQIFDRLKDAGITLKVETEDNVGKSNNSKL